MTLASLIQRETGLDEERAIVSAVYNNRLDRRMPLQCDPTVIYALMLDGHSGGPLLNVLGEVVGWAVRSQMDRALCVGGGTSPGGRRPGAATLAAF